MKSKVTAEALHALDSGRVGFAIDAEIERVVRDCMDRPGLKAERSVTIKIEIEPEAGEDGVCDAVFAEAQISSSMPPRRTRPMHMAAHPSGSLLFNDASPDDVRQGTLDEAGGGHDEGDAS